MATQSRPGLSREGQCDCKLYRKAPKNAVVLSIDEKTGIQAIERKQPGRVQTPGRLRRREFEYIRHGTQALIPALDVHTG